MPSTQSMPSGGTLPADQGPTLLFAGPTSRSVGPYLLDERVGRGGLGLVYRARRADGTGGEVALKYLRAGEDATPAERRSFARELEAARRLSHPGIVPILDAGEHGGMPWFTMPFIEAGSLERHLQAGPLPPAEAATDVARIARAVAHAHEHGVLHRDLKPANVLMGPDGPLVADFGLARFADQVTGYTHTGQLLGSLPYMSPEQACGQSHRVGPATDVWSMGVILYESLTGIRPFGTGGQAETLDRIRNARFRPPTEVAEVPPDLEAVVMRCLRREPGRRYPGAEALAADLERFAAGGRPLAAEDSTLTGGVPELPHSVARPLSLLLLPALLFLGVTAGSPGRERGSRADLNAVLARARPGSPAEIWSVARPPVWRPLAIGSGRSLVDAAPGRYGTLDTRGWMMLELLPPDPGRGPYRLRVEIRQSAGGEFSSRLGLYACHALGRYKGDTVHRCIDVGFDEPAFQVRRVPRPGPARADLCSSSHVVELSGVRSSSVERYATPAGVAPDRPPLGLPFRPLVLEVTRDGVAASADGVAFVRVPWADWGEAFARQEGRNEMFRGQPRPAGPSQAAGILVIRAVAEVRSVTYEPLAP